MNNIKKTSNKKELLCFLVKNILRRGRDSNPRYPFGVYTLSRRAPSTTRPPLPASIERFSICWLKSEAKNTLFLGFMQDSVSLTFSLNPF